jgi:hypothetical protein
MLIPVYIVGFIFGGLFLFAISQRIAHRGTQIVLRVIAVFAGPVFFLVVSVFPDGSGKGPTRWNGCEANALWIMRAIATHRRTM